MYQEQWWGGVPKRKHLTYLMHCMLPLHRINKTGEHCLERKSILKKVIGHTDLSHMKLVQVHPSAQMRCTFDYFYWILLNWDSWLWWCSVQKLMARSKSIRVFVLVWCVSFQGKSLKEGNIFGLPKCMHSHEVLEHMHKKQTKKLKFKFPKHQEAGQERVDGI